MITNRDHAQEALRGLRAAAAAIAQLDLGTLAQDHIAQIPKLLEGMELADNFAQDVIRQADQWARIRQAWPDATIDRLARGDDPHGPLRFRFTSAKKGPRCVIWADTMPEALDGADRHAQAALKRRRK